MYKVEYEDGEKSAFFANLITGNMLSHIDE